MQSSCITDRHCALRYRGTMLQFGVTTPNDTLLLGLHFYTQAYRFAPGQNALEVIVSNGVDWRVGNP
jgi:hypothetical protein